MQVIVVTQEREEGTPRPGRSPLSPEERQAAIERARAARDARLRASGQGVPPRPPHGPETAAEEVAPAAAAEQPAATPPPAETPARPPLTPEERQAAIERARVARAEREGQAARTEREAATAPAPAAAERARAVERARAAREREGLAFETAGGAAATARLAGRPPVARAVPRTTSRRGLVRAGFWAALFAMIGAAIGQFMDFFYPRGVTGFGGPVPAGTVKDYPPGSDPKYNPEGRFWMVHITPDKGGEGKYQGLLALWQRCPHLGCTVPWRPDFNFQGKTGWFRCPCHGSTYTIAGVRVFGPAPRSMDTMKIEVAADGRITVQTGIRTPGGTTAEDNPSRALKV